MMKTLLVSMLALATAGLATLCVVQAHKVAQGQKELVAQQTLAQEKAKAVAALEQAQQQREEHERELLRQSDALVAQAREQQAAVSNQVAARFTGGGAEAETGGQGKESSGMGSFLSKMMSDPETKKMIQAAQRSMMDQLYSPLVKRLGLTPEETEKFNNLLADHVTQTTEQASSMFGAPGSTNRTAFASQMAEQQKSFDQQVKALLGDDRFAQYQDYQQTVGERTQLNMYKQQAAGSDHPLSDAQTEQLLGFMKEERQNVATATGQAMPEPGQGAAGFEAMLSEDKLNTLLQSQADVNQRVYDRARDVLTPDQLDAFGKFQTNQLQMMRMGMTMARKMFAAPTGAPSLAPPSPPSPVPPGP